jgi:hypothetical protein
MNLNRENILSTIRTLEYFENTFSKDKNVDCINQTISLLMSELVEPITDEEYDAYVVKKRKEEFKKSTELTECIVNWELYHKMRGKTNQIKTSYDDYYGKNKVLTVEKARKITENFGISDVDLTYYFNRIKEEANKGNSQVLFDSMEFEVLKSLEKVGFSISWVSSDCDTEKGWLLKC